METRLGEGVVLEGGPLPVRYLENPLVLSDSPPPYHAPLRRLKSLSTVYSWKAGSPSGPIACVGEYFKKDCPKGHESRVIYVGCRKPDCEKCAGGRSYRRAGEIWKSHLGRIDAPWGVFVFTAPIELHPLIDLKLARELESEAWNVLESWLASTNKIDLAWARDAGLGGGTFGAFSWIHPEGDKRPGVWEPHWNFIVPMRSAAGGKDLALYWRKDEFEVLMSRLRAAWKGVLEKRFGKLTGEINLHYEARYGMGKKKHALTYFGRTFPGWSRLRLSPRRWGYFSNRLIGEHRWGWEDVYAPPWSDKRCHVCGSELVDSGTCDEESAKQIRRLQKERRREAG